MIKKKNELTLKKLDEIIDEMENEVIDYSRYYQVCVLVLDDGTQCVFIGKVQLLLEDGRKIVSTKVSLPKKLPDDCSFEIVEEKIK